MIIHVVVTGMYDAVVCFNDSLLDRDSSTRGPAGCYDQQGVQRQLEVVSGEAQALRDVARRAGQWTTETE